MPYDFLNNNPLLADMSPEKLQFLMNFATAKKPTDTKAEHVRRRICQS